jgi:hypothetical protein
MKGDHKRDRLSSYDDSAKLNAAKNHVKNSQGRHKPHWGEGNPERRQADPINRPNHSDRVCNTGLD